jgi:signal transduction histidine kinase
LQEDALDLAAVIGQAVRMVEPRAASGGIVLENRGAPSCVLVGDERRLRQVLLNVIGNAVKFTPPGGRVTVETVCDAGCEVTVRIADTGAGIDADDLPRVFEPFWQASSGLDRRHEGTGLGLPVSKRLMALHGGDLAIASVRGAGTVVTLRLPASRRHRALDAAD